MHTRVESVISQCVIFFERDLAWKIHISIENWKNTVSTTKTRLTLRALVKSYTLTHEIASHTLAASHYVTRNSLLGIGSTQWTFSVAGRRHFDFFTSDFANTRLDSIDFWWLTALDLHIFADFDDFTTCRGDFDVGVCGWGSSFRRQQQRTTSLTNIWWFYLEEEDGYKIRSRVRLVLGVN